MESLDRTMKSFAKPDQQGNPKYLFKKALRPFSFPVALITCLIGVVMAHQTGDVDALSITLILLAGLFLQAGVNLINDHADLKNHASANTLLPIDKTRIAFNYRAGWLCFLICSLIGLYLVSQTGIFLLLIAIVGGLGAVFYTTEPVNYKRRGLGVVLVFFFMGVFMIYGAFYAAIGQHSMNVIYASLPISFLTSALLLSNELRDYTADKQQNINTLTVRIGYHTGKKLYQTLIVLSFVSLAPLVITTTSAIHLMVLAPALLMAVNAIKSVNSIKHTATPTTTTTTTTTNNSNTPNKDSGTFKDNRLVYLPPKTGKLYLVFGIGQVTLMLLSH